MGESEVEALWKSQFIDNRVRTALEGLFSADEPGLVRLIRKKTPGLMPAEIRDSVRRATVSIHFPEVSAQTLVATEKESAQKPQARKRKSPSRIAGGIPDLIGAGLIVPPMGLEKKYKSVHLEATIVEGGQVVWDGSTYDSPSTAAGMARKSVVGAPEGRPYPQTNGWAFWQYRDAETGRLQYIDNLRQQYLGEADPSRE